jgi:hypothetical protein
VENLKFETLVYLLSRDRERFADILLGCLLSLCLPLLVQHNDLAGLKKMRLIKKYFPTT